MKARHSSLARACLHKCKCCFFFVARPVHLFIDIFLPQRPYHGEANDFLRLHVQHFYLTCIFQKFSTLCGKTNLPRRPSNISSHFASSKYISTIAQLLVERNSLSSVPFTKWLDSENEISNGPVHVNVLVTTTTIINFCQRTGNDDEDLAK